MRRDASPPSCEGMLSNADGMSDNGRGLHRPRARANCRTRVDSGARRRRGRVVLAAESDAATASTDDSSTARREGEGGEETTGEAAPRGNPPDDDVIDLLSSSSSDSDSGEVEIVESTAEARQGAAAASEEAGAEGGALLDDDADIVVTGDTGRVWNVSLAHARYCCGVHEFKMRCTTSNASYCDECFCYICDVKVSKCTQWGTGTRSAHHCNAYNCKKFLLMKEEAAAKKRQRLDTSPPAQHQPPPPMVRHRPPQPSRPSQRRFPVRRGRSAARSSVTGEHGA